MKNIGIVLVVLGILALVYGGISYSRNRTVLDMGSMSVSTTEHKSIQIPAIIGVVVLVGGVALMMTDKRRSSSQ